MLQILERRSHLTSVLETSVLTVTGTPAADTIFFYAKDGRLAVNENGVVHTFAPSKVKKIVVLCGAGDDSVTLGSRKFNSAIFGGQGNDSLAGGRANDTLYGENGDDVLNGKAGRDNLRGGLGSDLMFGGEGTDTADYIDRIEPVSVSIGGGYNDGAANEHDNVAVDIENLRGSAGDSVLIGSAGPNFLESGRVQTASGSRVTLKGLGGDDLLVAESTTLALLEGGPGNDDLYDYGFGTLRGGSGNDLLYSFNSTYNTVDGGDGSDIASGDFNVIRQQNTDIQKDNAINVEAIRIADSLPHFRLTAEEYWESIGGR